MLEGANTVRMSCCMPVLSFAISNVSCTRRNPDTHWAHCYGFSFQANETLWPHTIAMLPPGLEDFKMGKGRQRTLAALLMTIALVMPDMAGAAQSNQCIACGVGSSDRGHLHCDSAESTAGASLVADSAKEDSVVSLPGTVPEQSRIDTGSADSSRSAHYPRWTVSAEAIVLDRVGSADRTLVERVPGSVSFAKVPSTPGTPALNSTDLNQGFAPGMRLGVTCQVAPNYGLELSFFRVSGWDSTRSIGPDNPPNWLVMRAPGSFFQTQDFSYQSMTWDYSTELYNAELNVRYTLTSRITMLAGFRWLQLNDNLSGTLPPPDRILPLWKFNPNNTLLDVARIEKLPGIPATGTFPPFWNASTANNLYGLQIGADGRLFEHGPFSLEGLIKAGGYWNHASESTGVSLQKVVYPSGAATDHAAFVGEAGLQCGYQLTGGLKLKLGYELLWLDGVALAPGQIQETFTISPATVNALGVNSASGVLFHGATAGLEFSF